jgi:hypothetical protein
MTAPKIEKPASFLSKRRLGIAGLAAMISCMTCWALPFVVAGVGGGAALAVGRLLRPGFEPVIGAIVFGVVLAVMAIRNRLKRQGGNGPSCATDVGR